MLHSTLHKYTDDRREVRGSCKRCLLCLELYFTDIKPVKPYLKYDHVSNSCFTAVKRIDINIRQFGSETNKTPKWPKKNSLSTSPEAEHEKNKGRSYSRFKAVVFTSTFALFPMTYLF